MNSLVLLMDGPHSYEFALEEERLAQEVIEFAQVKRRLEYIQERMALKNL